MKNRLTHHTALRQQGASLIEVLVALLLVSVGLLGMAGLSSAGLGHSKASQLRLTGTALANDYADRARANIYGYDLGQYDIDFDDDAPAHPAWSASQTDMPTAAGHVADYDKAAFINLVADRLPSGQVVVKSIRTPNQRVLNLWVLWREAETEAAGDGEAATAARALFEANRDGNCEAIEDDVGEDNWELYSCMFFKVEL